MPLVVLMMAFLDDGVRHPAMAMPRGVRPAAMNLRRSD
jgi:hypothetical protein